MDTDTVNEILDQIKIIKQNIKQQIENYTDFTKVVIIGVTGSAKSSIACELAKKEVNIEDSNGINTILVGEGICHGSKSGTEVPNFYIDPVKKQIICDCQGFNDSNGEKQEIINTFSLYSIFEASHATKYKILLVISAAEIDAARGQAVTKTIQRMMKMFPNLEQLEKAIGLVITKGNEKVDAPSYLAQMEYNASENVRQWCNFFKSNIDHVFTFPMASRKKIGEQYTFNDLPRLESFIANDPIVDPIHKIELSENASLFAQNIELNCIQKVEQTIKSIFVKFSQQYLIERSSVQLKNWINLLNNFKNAKVNNNNKLKDYIHTIFPGDLSYDELFTKLDDVSFVNCFIDNIFGNNNYSSNLQQVIESNIDISLQDINNLYGHALENEELERKQIEINKQLEQKKREMEEQRRKDEERQRQLEREKREQEEKERQKAEEIKRLEQIALENQMRFEMQRFQEYQRRELEERFNREHRFDRGFQPVHTIYSSNDCNIA